MRAFVSLVLSCLVLSCDGSGDGSGATGLSLNESGSTVIVDNGWTACNVADDCVVVSSSCDGCCEQVAITASLAEDYQDARQNLCEDYEGGVCDCAPVETTLECVASSCVLIPE